VLRKRETCAYDNPLEPTRKILSKREGQSYWNPGEIVCSGSHGGPANLGRLTGLSRGRGLVSFQTRKETFRPKGQGSYHGTFTWTRSDQNTKKIRFGRQSVERRAEDYSKYAPKIGERVQGGNTHARREKKNKRRETLEGLKSNRLGEEGNTIESQRKRGTSCRNGGKVWISSAQWPPCRVVLM